MSLDSTAELLFHIGADSDDAEANIQRFRALLGKDLDDLTGEFKQWSTGVFGEMTTVAGALTAVTAAAGAGVVALGGLLLEAAHKYEEYVGEISHASKVTGIAIDEMSKLAFAAEKTGVSHEQLTHAITFFESQVLKAASSSDAYEKSFGRLGISQKQVQQGQKDIVPLLELTMDKFRGLASGTENAAMARQLFTRTGAEMLPFLKLGSAGLHEMAEEAARLGKILGQEDADAYRKNKLAMQEFHESMQAFAESIGREVLPYLTQFLALILAMPRIFSDVKTHLYALASAMTGSMRSLIDASVAESSLIANATAEIEQHLNHLMDVTRRANLAEALAPPKMEEAAHKVIYWQDMISRGAKIMEEEWKKAREEMQKFDELSLDASKLGGEIDKDALKEQAKEAADVVKQVFAMIPGSIDFAQEEAFARESIAMHRHLDELLRAYETTEERLANEYKLDLEKYSAVEEAKAAAAVRGTEHEQEVHTQYAQMRAALLTKYGQDLTALQNSQGWQGVFGSKFQQLLKGDEAMLKEWATSADQSLLLVKDSMQMLGQIGEESFNKLTEGMGAGIASAIVYSKSIGQAMQAALASTLESVAAQALVLAIQSTAWGFYDLAQQNYAGAEAAFTAAAIFGAVGGTAAVAGRFAAPSSQTGAGSQQGRTAAAGAGGMGTPGASTPLGQGPGVHVYVYGHIFGVGGVEELCQAINDATLNRDVTLTATNTITGVQVVR